MALSLWIIVLLDFLYSIDTQSAQGPNYVISKQEAVEECSNQGKILANYRDIAENPKASEYLSVLRNGESAWIDGYAEWSPFISWHGCFNTPKNWLNVPKYELGTKDLFACLSRCKHHSIDGKLLYIGVKKVSCYCISDFQRRNIIAVDDKLCVTSCDYNAVDSCGSRSYMSVYVTVIESSSTTRWAAGEPYGRPCVYIKKSQSLYNLYTASCHTIEALTISGYFCTHGAYSELITTACNVTYESNRYCIIKEAVTRQNAFKTCLGWNGMMTDLTAAKHTQKHLANDNKRYWIGVHRTFRLSDSRGFGMVCAAAIKANDTLYLEPDDCNRQKHYLCKGKTNLHSNQITSTISNPVGSTTASNATIKKTDNETPIAYIIPSVLIVILLVAIIIFVICCRYKNRINRYTSEGTGTYNARYKTDNLVNEQTVSSVSSDPGQNGEFKCLIVKPKPDKPVRQTLKRRTQGIEYENFTLKPEKTESQETKQKNEKEKQKQVDEYDKLNFKQRNSVKKDADEEANVYNHVVDTDNDNYDTMKSTKSSHSLGTCKLDNTYSHMKDGVVIGGCCDLATPEEKQCKDEKRVNWSENTNQAEKGNTLDKNKQPPFVIVDDDSFEGVSNGDNINEMTHSQPITYTEIAEVGVRREMEYSEITKGADQDLDDKLSFESVEDECGFRLPEKHSDITVKHVQCIDRDHLKDNEELILGDVDSAEQKPQLNYVDLAINDTVEAEQA